MRGVVVTKIVEDVQLDVSDDQQLRIVGRSGAALLIAKTPWTGDVNGTCVTEDRFTISAIAPDRIVHYVNRVLTPSDLLSLHDFVEAALVQGNLDLIPPASSDTAGFELSVRAIENDALDLSFSIVAYLDDDIPEADGVVFLVNRIALWDARGVLDRWLSLDTDAPDDISGLGGR
jgi:hypothetical protein